MTRTCWRRRNPVATFDAETRKWLAERVMNIAESWYTPSEAILEISPGYEPRPLRYKDVMKMLTERHSYFDPVEWSDALRHEREEWLVATVEGLASSGALTHPIYRRRPARKGLLKPDNETKQWIEENAFEVVESAYQNYWEEVERGKNPKYPYRPHEPRMTVGMITDDLRMMGDRTELFDDVHKSVQQKWVKSALEKLFRRGVVGKSLCISPMGGREAYCYDIPRE
jgi:hypothetical protein